jgi:hypothetical protein
VRCPVVACELATWWSSQKHVGLVVNDVALRSAQPGQHRAQVHESLYGPCVGDKWDGQATQRVPDHDKVIVGTCERLNSGGGVGRRASCRVFARQVDSECAMATSLELGDGWAPAPSAVVRAMNEPESGHRTNFAAV